MQSKVLTERTGAAYAPFVVDYNGTSYISIQAGTNKQPDTNASYWSVLAQIGNTGPTGATGATGPQGATGLQGIPGVELTRRR
jgi:hypothetical protein